MFGSGLLKGLAITWKEMLTPKVTIQYPDEIYSLPDRFHGRFKLDKDACISCGMCVRACPNNVIKMETETVARKKRLLKYVMDIKYCLFCGFCVESCPKNALGYEKDFELAQYKLDKVPLVLVDEEPLPPEEKERLEAEAAQKIAAAKAKKEASGGKDKGGE
ncbi:MAG: NADH-quinone oxidoreductase subunit I [Desulfotomaculum sp.]|nr:NADH-quinone oxidoreductase subunit I [Desulfotomaculum sp.]